MDNFSARMCSKISLTDACTGTVTSPFNLGFFGLLFPSATAPTTLFDEDDMLFARFGDLLGKRAPTNNYLSANKCLFCYLLK
jgi:hypothetical protein